MVKKWFLILFILVLMIGTFESIAQYQPSEQDPGKPKSLYPQPGPGEIAILKELQETNRLLKEQIQILNDQNRLLKENLTRLETNSKK